MRPEEPKVEADSGVGFLGGASGLLPTSLGVWGVFRAPQRGLERSPDRAKASHYFQHSGWPLLALYY